MAVGRIAADGALSITLSGAWTLRSGLRPLTPTARRTSLRAGQFAMVEAPPLATYESRT